MTQQRIADGSSATAFRAERAFVRMLEACMNVSAKAVRLADALDEVTDHDLKTCWDSAPARGR